MRMQSTTVYVEEKGEKKRQDPTPEKGRVTRTASWRHTPNFFSLGSQHWIVSLDIVEPKENVRNTVGKFMYHGRLAGVGRI